jgi:Flp pilus assembly protein TadG
LAARFPFQLEAAMTQPTTMERLRAQFAALCRDRAANVMITFAVILVPIVGAVGVAVDYSRANSARAAMQAALDSTALAMGKQYQDLNPGNIDKKAASLFKALFNRTEAHGIKIGAKLDPVAESLTLTGDGVVDTAFARVLGIKKVKIDVTSTVLWGTNKKIEIVLVLDNTGSMNSSGKIDALKKASKDFIDAMKKASKKSGDVKVAIVPFDTHVNIGPAYKSAAWIDWSLMTSASGGGWGGGSSWNGSNNYGDADDDTRFDDDRTDKLNWSGCVIDRQQPYDIEDTPPSSNTATWYPAENCDLIPILPLTSDFNSAKSMIEKMKADGKTNLTIGLVWGWHALSPAVPLTEASAPSKEIIKYMVFLTDGLNTQNRWSTKAADIDARTKLVCDKIRKAGIQVFTIRVMEGNQSLLQSCATTPGMYYNVTQASQLQPVFADIARNLSQLRITK